MAEPRSPKGAKLPKSEITTVRLDPKLRYLAELAARKQRRSLSSFIEWAIEDALIRFPLREDENGPRTVMGESERLWDVDSSDRFVKLALNFPELLTHDEQILWKLIRENGSLWRGRFAPWNNEWTWSIDENAIVYDKLRKYWEAFQQVAAGEQPQVMLPDWPRKKPPGEAPSPPPKSTSGFDDMDDDIPF